MEIRSVAGAPLDVNCYLVADGNAGEAILVDAPWQVVPHVLRWCDELKVEVTVIACTHGHWDHTMGAHELREATGAPVAVHVEDEHLLTHPSYGPFSFPWELKALAPERLLRADDVLRVGAHDFTVLHLPGHTEGSCAFYNAAEGVLLSGDILFAGSCGRVDLPGGNAEEMITSLRRLQKLPPATRVLPGHGPETTIERELSWLDRAEEMLTW